MCVSARLRVAEQAAACDNGRCINTHGSYECECELGFVLDASAQHCLGEPCTLHSALTLHFVLLKEILDKKPFAMRKQHFY